MKYQYTINGNITKQLIKNNLNMILNILTIISYR
jgi:hypothetical protein